MSIHDPLGLLSYFTNRAKIVLNNAWRIGISGGDALAETKNREFLDEWRDINSVANLRLNRRRYGFNENTVGTQIHVFSDAIRYRTWL